MDRTPEQARSMVTTMLLVGVIALVIGGVVIGLSWPSTDLSEYSEYSEETGSWAGVFVGMFIAGVGQLLAIIGLVAIGVRLGVESSGTTTTTAPRAHSPLTPPTSGQPDRSHMDEDGL